MLEKGWLAQSLCYMIVLGIMIICGMVFQCVWHIKTGSSLD